MEVFDDRRCVLGEGPFYDDRTGWIGWVDITGSRILRRPVTGGPAAEEATPDHVGAVVLREDGTYVTCLAGGVAVGDDELIPFPPAPTLIRANDAKVDPLGCLWVGTIAYDGSPAVADLFRLEPGADRLVPVLTGLTISNGLGWSPDGSTMYHIDTPTKQITAYDFDGLPRGGRPFAEIDDGAPDGMCVDAAGGVWVALFGGGAVRRYHPDGSLDRVVPVPTPQVTSCAFAGPDLDLLIITTAARDRPDDPHAGLTYVHRPGDVGLPGHRFKG